MHTITPRDISGRSFHGASRATVDEVDDSHLMQEVAGVALPGDKRRGMERFQNYGLSSAILPRDQEQGSAGAQSGATADFAPPTKGKSAEALLIGLGGNRSHPVVVAIDDRRHRVQKLRPGEVVIFDDQTQQVHLTREGVVTSVPNGKKSSVRVMKSGDKVRNQKGGGDGHGQTPWRDKTPYADHEIDKDQSRTRHPKTVAHQVVEDGNLDAVKHYARITAEGGVKHASDNEQHSVTLKDGVVTKSTLAISDEAPSIGHNGPTTVTGTLGVSSLVSAGGYGTVSDRRVKEDIRPAAMGLPALLEIDVVDFRLKAEISERRVLGFIAQDLARIIPDAVAAGGHPEDETLLAIDTGQVLAVAVRAIQDLHKLVDELRGEIAALRNI